MNRYSRHRFGKTDGQPIASEDAPRGNEAQSEETDPQTLAKELTDPILQSLKEKLDKIDVTKPPDKKNESGT